jgi:hypothetical protein
MRQRTLTRIGQHPLNSISVLLICRPLFGFGVGLVLGLSRLLHLVRLHGFVRLLVSLGLGLVDLPVLLGVLLRLRNGIAICVVVLREGGSAQQQA